MYYTQYCVCYVVYNRDSIRRVYNDISTNMENKHSIHYSISRGEETVTFIITCGATVVNEIHGQLKCYITQHACMVYVYRH